MSAWEAVAKLHTLAVEQREDLEHCEHCLHADATGRRGSRHVLAANRYSGTRTILAERPGRTHRLLQKYRRYDRFRLAYREAIQSLRREGLLHLARTLEEMLQGHKAMVAAAEHAYANTRPAMADDAAETHARATTAVEGMLMTLEAAAVEAPTQLPDGPQPPASTGTAAASLPPDGPGGVPQMVTLQQMAAIVNRSKAAVEKIKSKLGAPHGRARNGQAHEWPWAMVRPVLSAQFGRELPEVWPADRLRRR